MGKANPQNEAELWLQFADKMKPYGHFCRVESHEVSDGIPDVDFCIKGTESHIELKFGNKHKIKKGFIRPSQVRWFRNRIKAGGRPWLFALFLEGGTPVYMLFDEIGLICQLQTTEAWRWHAKYVWEGKMDWYALYEMLSS